MVIALAGLAAYDYLDDTPTPDLADQNAADQELADFLLNSLSDGSPPDPARARQICHRVLRARSGNQHDAFLLLKDCGDSSSVPDLIRALRRQPKPSPGGGIVCTTAHCISALQTITHQNICNDPDAWARWCRFRWMRGWDDPQK